MSKVVLKKEKIVEIDCEQFQIKAIKGITMQIEVFSLTSSEVKMKTNLHVEGDVTLSGKLQSDADQVAAGISLSQHTHGGVESGGSNTQPPSK